MKFAYTILYVDNVEATVSFYERAFGLTRKMVHENDYGELETGGTKLAFAGKPHVKKMLQIPFHDSSLQSDPPPCEVGFVTDDVQSAFDKAVATGAIPVTKPATKPWGQIVAYVRDNNGFLVELCTAVE